MNQLDHLPSIGDMRFNENVTFRIKGAVYPNPVVMEVGRSFGNNWACADGTVIQEQAGSFGATKIWTGSSGLALYPPAPFDAPGLREGIKTPMSPKALALVRFYMVQYAKREGRKHILDFPDLDDLTEALRIALRPPSTEHGAPNVPKEIHVGFESKGNLKSLKFSAHVINGFIPTPSAAAAHPTPGAESMLPSPVPVSSQASGLAEHAANVSKTASTIPSIDGVSQSSHVSRFGSPLDQIRRRSNTVADWQASIPDEAFDASISDFEKEQDDDDTEAAAPHDSDSSPVVFATRANLRGQINGTLLKYLAPLKEITFVPSPQTGYVNIQILLGRRDGRPLHAVFKPSANKKVSPSFSVLVCGAKLAYQLFGDGWTKLDFGELTRVIGDWPSDLAWPFAAACNVEELKALCKWYFTLAADAGVHGFKDHLFPVKRDADNSFDEGL